jgi:hypothetical protein
MDAEWFEMAEIRRRKLDSSVWIPLRFIHEPISEGEYGHLGHRREFIGLATLAVPLRMRAKAADLGWTDVGIAHDHHPYVERGRYISVDVESHRDGVVGTRLVFSQRGSRAENRIWHVNQDLTIALGLKEEGDVWVAMHEGYAEVIRRVRDADGETHLIEIRAEYLKDYLCARRLALLVSSYRERRAVAEESATIIWSNGEEVTEPGARWQGSTRPIHEGGMPYGGKTAVFHAKRTDIDPATDVPTLGHPSDGNIESRQWTKEEKGRQLLTVSGAYWRTEWVEPGRASPRVRGDKVSSKVQFVVDAAGTAVLAESLKEYGGEIDAGRWLWFKPEVVGSLLSWRGAQLSFYTAQTGSVGCSPDYQVHFGINKLGLVSVYAKDIAFLPEWQQRIWAGYNVSPEGGVSHELLMSQVEADPAATLAPEEFLGPALEAVAEVGMRVCGKPILREHQKIASLRAVSHRFRSTSEDGFLALAKDVARLTADSLDAVVLQSRVKPPKGEPRWGALKSLEKVVALGIGDARARLAMGPLVGAYELRHSDAHLPPSTIAEARELLQVDSSLPYVHQGEQMLRAVVSALYAIADGLNKVADEASGS